MRLPAASVAALLLLLLPADTLVTAANGAASPIAAEQSWKHRLQARREDVLRRLSDISPRQLRSRSSPSSCDTVRDKNFECCASLALTTTLECCPDDQLVHQLCGPDVCCDDGVKFGEDLESGCCRFPGVVYQVPSLGIPGCCETAVIAPDGKCCAITERIEGDTCVPNVLWPIRARDLDSASRMTRRSEHTHRTLLSPDLVAEHLVNNGIFTYRGVEHIDLGHRAHNEGVLRRIAGRGISAAMKYALKFNVEYGEKQWNAMDYFGFSETYEFDIRDVPEIYARIVARPDFESFSWRGTKLDRDALYKLVRGHPGFNASLVEQYRR